MKRLFYFEIKLNLHFHISLAETILNQLVLVTKYSWQKKFSLFFTSKNSLAVIRSLPR